MEFRVNLFGTIRLSGSDRRLRPFPTARSRSLFCFLVLNRHRMYPRDVLAGVFWGDRPNATARKNLRNNLWRIRSILEPDDVARGRYLLTEGDAVGLTGSADLWVDVEEFERRIDASPGRPPDQLSEADRDSLCDAVALYRGDLMEEVYEDWCLVEQQRLKSRMLAAVEKLMRYHEAHGEWGSALLYAQRVLRADPLREHIQRDVMRYHYFQGNRPAALRQFETYARLLDTEMGIAPMQQTVRLREAISAESLRSGSADPVRDADSPFPGDVEARAGQPLGGQIRSALHEFELASARLRASLWKFQHGQTSVAPDSANRSPDRQKTRLGRS